MSDTLKNTYHWENPLLMAGLGVALVAGFLWWSGVPTWWVMALALLLMLAAYGVALWFRTRAAVTIDDDDVMHVRRWFGTHALAPGSVTRVRELVNGRSPDLILHTADRRKVVVPSSKLARGHSAVFRWLQDHNPDAAYDKGATKLRNRLRSEGHLPEVQQ